MYRYRGGGKEQTQTNTAYRVSKRYSVKHVTGSVVIGNTSPDISTAADKLVPDDTGDATDSVEINVSRSIVMTKEPH